MTSIQDAVVSDVICVSVEKFQLVSVFLDVEIRLELLYKKCFTDHPLEVVSVPASDDLYVWQKYSSVLRLF